MLLFHRYVVGVKRSDPPSCRYDDVSGNAVCFYEDRTTRICPKAHSSLLLLLLLPLDVQLQYVFHAEDSDIMT